MESSNQPSNIILVASNPFDNGPKLSSTNPPVVEMRHPRGSKNKK